MPKFNFDINEPRTIVPAKPRSFPLTRLVVVVVVAASALVGALLLLSGFDATLPKPATLIEWIILGWLMFVSRYLLKRLSMILMLAGLSFVTGMLAIILAPAFASSISLLPMILGMLLLALTLLMRGIDARAWVEKTVPPA